MTPPWTWVRVEHLSATALGLLVYAGCRVVYNLWFHPLARFPGPRAAACTRMWLAYQELVLGVSLADVRAELHRRYGEVLRLAPNELHFANPAAFNDIYNNRNKWDKDHNVYRAFDMDTGSIGFLHYADAKQRRDVLGPLFSRTSILKLQDLVQERVNVLCEALAKQFATGKSSDFLHGYQCFAVDVVMFFCYAKTLDATRAPNFEADVVLASEAVLPILTIGKYSGLFVRLVRHIPASFAIRFGSPLIRSLFLLRKMLTDQIDEILRNPSELEHASHQIIYHALLDPAAHKGRPLPSRQSLWHEAGALLGAGSDTTAVAATTTSYYILHNPAVQARLVQELRAAWPVLEEVPRFEVLEKLPLLSAVVKEGLRMFPGGTALPRVVPPEGAVIAGTFVPGGAVVGQSFTWVHTSPDVFDRPDEFLPERWLGPDAKTLEGSMAVFSKGPRSCLGMNLAYCELYLVIASVFRRFDVALDTKRPAKMTVMEHFAPVFTGEHLHAYCKPVADGFSGQPS
ncbi:cytochrome P450 [Gloeopeniophorella convolvens]|nr:cytochrome P450 [Gloeopeniophorella convolvens]